MLTDTVIRQFDNARHFPAKRLQIADRGGLALDVLPSGNRTWVYRYRLQNGQRFKMALGRYPDLSLKAARQERDKLAALVARGESPAEQRVQAKLKQRAREEGRSLDPTLREFADRWYRELVVPPKGRNHRRDPRSVRGALDNQILPVLGEKPLKEIMKADIRRLVFEKRNAGFEAAALFQRQILKMIFDYAVVEELLEFNPVILIPKDSIARLYARERDLSGEEIRVMLETVSASQMPRDFQVALRILLLTMVRKGELQRARWEHLHFDRNEWHIPREHSKTGKPHIVPLAPQVLELFRELETLACGSPHVLPSRYTIKKPLDLSTLNHAMRCIEFPIPHFIVHDLRRTAATHCAEAGFHGDVIERALNHVRAGIRGVYNRSELLEQRREMLCWWANRVDAMARGPRVFEILKNPA